MSNPPQLFASCAFETARLRVDKWHSVSPAPRSLERFVVSLLTDRVTASLPQGWAGAYDEERASSWISERDAEGTTLIAMEKAALEPVGLMILFESPGQRADGTSEVNVGYILAEGSWGKGLATEFLAGFVAWCRSRARLLISARVSAGNAASVAVLEKNGFERVSRSDEAGESVYRLDLRRRQ